ncbi:MAG: PAS domain-containing protein [Methylocystis sp.]|uniref:PAS domain-containing protein n=1 Tax=Methylocystis sp. TaxID=1911079 RepID=UPI003D0AE971
MRLRVTRNLYEYWDGLKGERSAPDRAEIDPLAIRHILADTFIIEADADRPFPLRLCGARINALWLKEQKGHHFLSWWTGRHQEEIAEAIRKVINDGIPIVAYAQAGAEEENAAEFELLLLPLRHFGKSHSRVLGSLAAVRPLPWLGICPVGPLDLLATRAANENDAAKTSKDGWRRRRTAGRASLAVRA